jgi:hypothetical protein
MPHVIVKLRPKKSEAQKARLANATFAGLAGPRVLGVPLFSYVLLLVFGLLTMSIPILIRSRSEIGLIRLRDRFIFPGGS